jgi:hypothetical protein
MVRKKLTDGFQATEGPVEQEACETDDSFWMKRGADSKKESLVFSRPFLRRDTSQFSCLIQAGKRVLFVSDSANMCFFL